MALVGALWLGCTDTSLPPPPPGPGGNPPPSGPTYYEAVAPILQQHCTGCHAPGGIAPFSLLTYDDARQVGGPMKAKTAARIMPPWPLDMSGSCGTWKDPRWLTDDEIATIGNWVDAGMLPGDPAGGPAPPAPPPQLQQVSASLDMGIEYYPNPALTDDYHCFILDPGIDHDQFLTAYQVVPGEPRVVHHIVLHSLDTPEAEQQAQALDQADPTPGYTCFGGSMVTGSRALAAWAPGVPLTAYPEGTGLRLLAGRKVVMQVHYNLTNGPLPDRTRVDLQLADSVGREAVITGIGPTLFSLPPGQSLVEQTASYTIPATVTSARVWAAFPHMHLLGRTLRVEIERAGATSCALAVANWDFHWQQFYEYAEPLVIQGGDRITITCGYNTTGQTATVTSGEGTGNEMCLAGFYVTL